MGNPCRRSLSESSRPLLGPHHEERGRENVGREARRSHGRRGTEIGRGPPCVGIEQMPDPASFDGQASLGIARRRDRLVRDPESRRGPSAIARIGDRHVRAAHGGDLAAEVEQRLANAGALERRDRAVESVALAPGALVDARFGGQAPRAARRGVQEEPVASRRGERPGESRGVGHAPLPAQVPGAHEREHGGVEGPLRALRPGEDRLEQLRDLRAEKNVLPRRRGVDPVQRPAGPPRRDQGFHARDFPHRLLARFERRGSIRAGHRHAEQRAHRLEAALDSRRGRCRLRRGADEGSAKTETQSQSDGTRDAGLGTRTAWDQRPGRTRSFADFRGLEAPVRARAPSRWARGRHWRQMPRIWWLCDRGRNPYPSQISSWRLSMRGS